MIFDLASLASPAFRRPRADTSAATTRLRQILLGASLCLATLLAHAVDGSPAPATTMPPRSIPAGDPQTAYRDVNLKELVPAARMPDGRRAIFAPSGVRFQARLAQLPTPQKSDYLQQVMSMMGMNPLPRVSQRIVVDYGGDKLLAAYVEEGVANRIGQQLKVGDSRTFYAFHVYNNRQGPALVITSFGD